VNNQPVQSAALGESKNLQISVAGTRAVAVSMAPKNNLPVGQQFSVALAEENKNRKLQISVVVLHWGQQSTNRKPQIAVAGVGKNKNNI